ncbi:hypothetical protein DNTS_032211 [Danionella cerebrum]|uniref:Uncharacterized protein n=1 Tax=Danionella cerebrum TaxID=2873325 RepID=A0A553N5S1_9TELE|nr:hypothetical protein DNTS_032211 [Danionella translucida]
MISSDQSHELCIEKTKGSDLSSAEGSVEQRVHKVKQQDMDFWERTLAGTDLKKEAPRIRSKYDFQMNHSYKKYVQLPTGYLIRSSSAEYSSKPSKVLLKELSKSRGREKPDKRSPPDFFEVVKEQLQKKDLEHQHVVQLLLGEQQENRDLKQILKHKELESQLLSERLKCEQQKKTDITTRLDSACEGLKRELSEAKNYNKASTQQLKALVEKYERLKRRANALKRQLNVEINEKKSCQKSLTKLQSMTEELLMKQKLLEEQRDLGRRDLTLCQETLQMMNAERKTNVCNIQRLEEELLAIRGDSAKLREQLHKVSEKNKELTQVAHSSEKNSQQLQETIEKLTADVEKIRTERSMAHQHVESLKSQSKQIENKQRVEILQLQDEQKALHLESHGMKRECNTLMELVSKLKKEKQDLMEKLESCRKEKILSCKEGDRLKEAIGLLQREREVLFAEMEDLRKDYLGLSDRITQRLSHMEDGGTDPPLTITDITTSHQRCSLLLKMTLALHMAITTTINEAIIEDCQVA